MSVLIEDSPRNLVTWITDALAARIVTGAVVTPFATPWNSTPHRRGAPEVVTTVDDFEGQVWFDPTTHALQMAGVGDFRYYDEYDLWDGQRGNLDTRAAQTDHIRRVFDVQDRLAAPHLAPTILLHHGESSTSQRALDLARESVERDPACFLSVAGTAPFWSSGSSIDSHVGALAQLDPAGWFLTVARPMYTLPVEAESEEIHGLCRTARALSEYAPVHICYGDLAGLPAIAAGATSLGSGWDQRQRVCAFGNFSARDPSATGGAWYKRPTFRGLIGSLKPNEAEVLQYRDPGRVARLGAPPPPGPKEAFLHHVKLLDEFVADLVAQSDPRQRYQMLAEAYDEAAKEWPPVVKITSSPHGEEDWIRNLAAGLRLYARTEGW
jgi:hypothetical protein